MNRKQWFVLALSFMLLGMFFIIQDINHGFIIGPIGLGDHCISISYGIDIKPLDKYDVLCVVR